MNLFFASMHGGALTEIALLCRGAGVQLLAPSEGCRLVRTLIKEADRTWMTELGIRILSDDEILGMVSANAIDASMLSTPDQMAQFAERISPKIKLIIRHGLNSFDKFRKKGTRNFMSCSPKAIEKMGVNSFLMRKLVDWTKFGPPAPIDCRAGIFSYIHYYRSQWPAACTKFDRFNGNAREKATCFGFGNEAGFVDDLSKMRFAAATLHLKDGQAVCNAVVRSMACGTPVLMDEETRDKCHFDAVDGMIVAKTPEALASVWNDLDHDDDALEEACKGARSAAERQFSYDDELGRRFVSFLEGLK